MRLPAEVQLYLHDLLHSVYFSGSSVMIIRHIVQFYSIFVNFHTDILYFLGVVAMIE